MGEVNEETRVAYAKAMQNLTAEEAMSVVRYFAQLHGE
jgi:hypothetical protein